MTYNFVDPYTGKDTETCSASVKAQQEMGAGSTGSPQTEAQFNLSKQLGEWGVIVAKINKGEIPNGTKVLAYTKPSTGGRGYLYVKNGELWKKVYDGQGKLAVDEKSGYSFGEAFIASANFDTTIPQALSPKPKPEGVPFTEDDGQKLSSDVTALKNGQVLAVAPSGDYISYNTEQDKFELYTKGPEGYGHTLADQSYYMPSLMSGNTWLKPDGKDSTPAATPKVTTPKAAPSVIASPTPSSAVNPGSDSVGSMSHEDVAAMFVKIKDDLAKEQGLNIKGANPQLDQLVFSKIGDKTGYTAAEVKAKIDEYKAEGNKLSALKKKVLAGTKKVPEGKAQPTKATPAAPLNVPTATNKPAADPKPNGVPTTATPKLADEVKAEVKKEVKADPAKAYSDEDVAAAYIIAKDAIVASNTHGWTLYTKNDAFDLEIAIQVGLKTGLNPLQQKQAIASYLATGKKLSALKKQLAKQGAFTPKADSLKKSGADKDQAAKAKDVDAKADAGYTPTPTPATSQPAATESIPLFSNYLSAGTGGAAQFQKDLKAWKAKHGNATTAKSTTPVDTGKPAPKAVVAEAEKSGDISDISDSLKAVIFSKFKGTGSQSYLSSGSGSNYEGFAATQAAMKVAGHDLSLLQLIRVVDEQGAKKAGVENGKLFEKQVATWLTTPEGTKYVNDKQVELAEKAEKAAKDKAAKEEAQRLAKELEANQPPLPADSALFESWSLDKALRISKTWLEREPWTAKQKAGLRHYTGSAYHEMNGYLRGLQSSISASSKTHIKGTMEGMRPTTEPILVKRGTGLDQFKTLGIGRGEKNFVWGITGKTFKDEGFLSTSAGGKEAFSSKEATLEIECPVGTPMAYVDPISKVPGENEMLLQAGMEYKVLQVRTSATGKPIIRLRVVNWPGKAS
jgi:hypothetical protein